MSRTARWALFVVLALVIAACAGDTADTTEAPPETEAPVATAAPTTMAPETTTTTEPPPAVGSPENPIKVLFVPSAEAAVIVTGGEIMKEALEAATGLSFEVSVPTSYAATIEEMCASPENTIGFIPAFGYVLASEECGVDVEFAAVRFGWSVYWAQFLVARDSDIQTLEDLEGLRWAYGDTGSTSGYIVPAVMFDDLGIMTGDVVETGGHGQTALAVYNGEADFGTTFFSPPLTPDFDWALGDEPDIPDDLIESCAPNEDGSQLLCGPADAQWRVLDARASARADAPDIMQKVRILTISEAIPNDTLSFGPDFPADVRAQIAEALVAFAETEAWEASIGNQDFYGWSGLAPASDSDFDTVRKMVALVGFDPDA